MWRINVGRIKGAMGVQYQKIMHLLVVQAGLDL